MPSTPKFGIRYPDGTTAYAPLQDHFAAIASDTEAALTTGLGGAPRLANSDSERSTLFPSPVQGNSVLRPDKGYVEQYFALYNSSTNPSGATPAGWYPVSGALPYAKVVRNTTGVSIGFSAYSMLDSNSWWTLTGGGANPGMGTTPYNAGWVVPIAGWYELTANFTSLGSTGGTLVGWKNDTGTVTAPTDMRGGGSNMHVQNWTEHFAVWQVYLTPSSQPRLWSLSTGANAAIQTGANNYQSIKYIAPPVGIVN